MYVKSLSALAFVCCSLVVGQADAAITSWILSNHPDGGVAPPKYGFRLDELFDVTGGHDKFTFDFEHASSSMTLSHNDGGTAGDLSDDVVRIFGTAFGGLDTGSAYGDPLRRGVWNIDFSYTDNFVDPGGSGTAVKINPESQLANIGTIAPLFDFGGVASTNGVDIGLVDEDGGKGFSFKFNNFDDHRLGGTGLSGPDTYVGWGWVNHGGNPHVAASDWLFTARQPPTFTVPEPSSLALLAIGSMTALGIRRRRSRQNTTR